MGNSKMIWSTIITLALVTISSTSVVGNTCKGFCVSYCYTGEYQDSNAKCSNGGKCCIPKQLVCKGICSIPCHSSETEDPSGLCPGGFKCCVSQKPVTSKCRGGCYDFCINSEYHDPNGNCPSGSKCCVPNAVINPPVTNKCKGGCYDYCINSEYHDPYGNCPSGSKCCIPKTVINPPTKPPTKPPIGPIITDGTCGKTKFDFGRSESRIVGGRKAKKGEFPWQVQVQQYGGHWCGGTLLDDQWVLSAAHCFANPPSHYKFVLGQHDSKLSEGTEQTFSASKLIKHENFGNGNMRYDIALIKLNRKVQFNEYVRTACMPSPNEYFVGQTNCIVSGWGGLNEGALGPRILNAVKKPVISNAVCKQAYGSSIYDSNICGGYAAGGKDACQGDSGGPYVCKKAGQPWKIVGVVSWGHGCARPGKYGVYASVPYFYNWIKTNQAKYN